MSLKLVQQKNEKYIQFKGKKYAFNLEKFREVCTPVPSEFGPREFELSQIYERDETGDFSIQQKVEHETKSAGNQQSDMIVYDVVKMMIVSILENSQTEKELEWDLGTAIAMNTLISWGVLEEL